MLNLIIHLGLRLKGTRQYSMRNSWDNGGGGGVENEKREIREVWPLMTFETDVNED
jgi:hypothetical protein